MATNNIASDKSETPVGAAGTKLYTSTRTTYEVDANGKIDPNSVKHEIILYDAPLSPGVVAATSTGTSNEFTFLNKPLSNTPYFGADAQKSLKEGALKSTTQQQIQTAATKAGIPPEQQKTLTTKQLNIASSQEGGDPNNKALEQDLSSTSKYTRLSFPLNLRYPENLNSDKQDVIFFNMLKYEPRKPNEGGTANLGSFGPRSDFSKRTIGRVILPIPNGISDQNLANWSSDEITSAQKALSDLASAGITGGVSSAANTLSNQAESIEKNSSQIGKGLVASFTEQAVGVKNILSRTQGAIQNPNMELLFLGPQLRSFNFTFKLSARNSTEAKAIRSIIRFFKQGMSPQKSEANLFLRAPNTFQLVYKHVNEDHSFLNKFKECALQSFSVDYTPEGQYATFTDGAMVSYQIQMQFQELEPLFNEDYGNAENKPDTEIGY